MTFQTDEGGEFENTLKLTLSMFTQSGDLKTDADYELYRQGIQNKIMQDELDIRNLSPTQFATVTIEYMLYKRIESGAITSYKALTREANTMVGLALAEIRDINDDQIPTGQYFHYKLNYPFGKEI